MNLVLPKLFFSCVHSFIFTLACYFMAYSSLCDLFAERIGLIEEGYKKEEGYGFRGLYGFRS